MPETYQSVVNAAVEEMSQTGFDSAERVAYWQRRLKEAAEASMRPPHQMEQDLRDAMAATWRRLVEKGGMMQYHQGVKRLGLEAIRPAMRVELDRRILAAANLIKLNRTEAIEKTLRRFAGWSTSIPKGGAAPGQRAEAKEDVKKAMRSLPFVERRVLIDQGHKLVASINEIAATDGGALAGRWNSHWRQKGYDYREDHRERDPGKAGEGNVYLMRDSWAQAQGLVRPGPDGYYDQITSAGEEPFCRCYVTWLYSLRRLPPEMLTKKGAAALAEARMKVDAA